MEKNLKCFISAPAEKGTSSLRRILGRLGVQSIDAFDFEIGDSISASVKSKIRASDFAIVVLSEQNSNVLYELGICEGLGKPVFLLVEDSYNTPPFVSNYIYLRASLDNESLLIISLENFIAQLRKNKTALRGRKKSFVDKKNETSSVTRNYLSQIDRLRSQGQPTEIEESVRRLFKELSISIETISDRSKDVGVDFAIWADKLSNTIGSLVLVELKYGSLNERKIQSAERQLQTYLERSEAKAGILLYLDREGKRFKENFTFTPLILRYDLEDFIKQINISSFEDAVLSKRNKMVHGIK